jgi:hypothetical protein
MPATRRPPCPRCQTLTSWIRSSPARPGYTAHAYECPVCAFIMTDVLGGGDVQVLRDEGPVVDNSWMDISLRE